MSPSSPAIAAAALMLCVASAACVDTGGEPLLILQNSEPGADCQPNVSATRFLSSGLIDTGADVGYVFTPLVESLIEEQGNADRRIFISGANVDIRFQGDIFSAGERETMREEALTSFSQSFSASIGPSDRVALAFTVVPKTLLTRMEGKLGDGEFATLFAEVSILGTLGDGDVESNVFTYPIDVCNGCTQNVVGDCSALPEAFTAREGGICQPLQDGFVDCCLSDGTLICPAVATSPPEDPM